MSGLDSCINNIYEPGFIKASSGEPPTDPLLLDYSLDFSISYNSLYLGPGVL